MISRQTVGIAVLASIFLLLAGYATTTAASPLEKPDIIEVISLKGEVNPWMAQQVKDAVDKINETPKVKAVLLEVDSPGGGVGASYAVYTELSKIKAPVLGYCPALCASGGQHALMAPNVKFIAVGEEAIGGSVGVIATVTRFHRLLEWAKIDNETYTSGPLKDAFNPTRAATETDRKSIQALIDVLAAKFYQVVVKARGDKVRPHMDAIKSAGVFIGEQNVEVGLADAVMTRDEALVKLKELSGSKNIFTRDELTKIVKNASDAAQMRAPVPEGWTNRAMKHADTIMEIVGEMRAGESLRFEYRLPWRF